MDNMKFADREFLCWWGSPYLQANKHRTYKGKWFLQPKNGYSEESVEELQALEFGEATVLDDGAHIVTRIK